MSETLNKADKEASFDSGIAYEGLREALNNEMARHSSLVAEYGEDTEAGQRHLNSMQALAEVRRHLHPDDPEMLLVVELMLESHRSDIESTHTAA